jgi:hypothetical protein
MLRRDSAGFGPIGPIATWYALSALALAQGLRALEFWQRAWLVLLAAPGGGSAGRFRTPPPGSAAIDAASLLGPWLPRVEAVIRPITRPEDGRPDPQAARLSMRIRLPDLGWAGNAGQTVTVDAIVRRERGPALAPSAGSAEPPARPDDKAVVTPIQRASKRIPRKQP